MEKEIIDAKVMEEKCGGRIGSPTNQPWALAIHGPKSLTPLGTTERWMKVRPQTVKA